MTISDLIDTRQRLLEFGEGLQAVYTSPDGAVFSMYGPSMGDSGVVLGDEGLSPLQATAKRDTKPNPDGIGERIAGRSYPAFGGDLRVILYNNGDAVGDVLRRWRDAWSDERPGVLKLIHQPAGNFSTRVWLNGAFSPIVRDPWITDALTDRVPWIAYDGFWTGPKRVYGPGSHDVIAGGQMPARVELVTTRQGPSTFTYPHGVQLTVTNPDSRRRHIDLGFGMSGRVTFDDGTIDNPAWAQLGARTTSMTIKPHTPVACTVGDGLELHVTPRYRDPWS